MTTGQLTVSAIRQQFESTSHLETSRPQHDMPSKSEYETVTPRKQPPKTRPKPKRSVVTSAQCGDVKSAGDLASANHPVVSVMSHCQLERNHSADDDTVSLSSSCLTSSSDSSTIRTACEDTETVSSRPSKHPLAAKVSFDDPMQALRVFVDSVSRDELDIVRPSAIKHAELNRLASTSSLLSNVVVPSADDVKEAINRAKQKRVLQRIIGMKLEGEIMPEYVCEAANEATLHSAETVTDTMPDGDLQADDVSSDQRPTSVADVSQPLSDDLIQNVILERNTSPTSEMLLTDEITVKNEESSSTETESSSRESDRRASEQTRRPISLFPEDIGLQAPPVDTDSAESVTDVHVGVHSPPSTDNGDCTPDPAHLPPLPTVRSSLTENDLNISSVKQVAVSRKSYLVLGEFVGDNFSFLDDFDTSTETEHESLDVFGHGDDDIEQVAELPSRPTSSVDQICSAATVKCCTENTCEEKELVAEMAQDNKRPKSLARKSIVLPNGKILEIVGNAFMFLDDYDEQIGAD